MRWLGILVAILLIITSVLAGVAAWLLASDAGTRWWVAQVDARLAELEFEGVTGNARTGLEIERLTYLGDPMVTFGSLELSVELWPLLDLTALNIKNLKADRVSITPNAASAAGPAALTNLALPAPPMPVSLRTAEIEELHYAGTRVSTLAFSGAWDAAGIRVEHLTLQLDDLVLTSTGTISNTVPVSLATSISWNAADLEGRLTATGGLNDLQIRHELEGTDIGTLMSTGSVELNGRARAALRHQAPGLDFTTETVGSGNRWQNTLRGTFSGVPITAEIQADIAVTETSLLLQHGTIADTLNVRGEATIVGDAVTADAQLSADNLAGLVPEVEGNLHGSVGWRDGNISADLASDALRYHDVPVTEFRMALAGTVKQLVFDAEWREGRLSGRVEAAGDGRTITVDPGTRLGIDTFTLANESGFTVGQSDEYWTVASHCWEGLGEICIEQTRLTNGRAALAGRLKDVPLASADVWLPAEIDAASRLNGTWRWEYHDGGWQADTRLTATSLGLVINGLHFEALPDLSLDAHATPAGLALSLDGENERFSISLEADSEGMSTNAAISGKAAFAVDAAALPSLAESPARLDGAVAAELELGGTIAAPRFNASGSWQQGLLHWQDPALALQDIQINWQADNDRWQIEGSAAPREGGALTIQASGTDYEFSEFRASGAWTDATLQWQEPEVSLTDINLQWSATDRGWLINGTAVPDKGSTLTVSASGDGFDRSANITAEVSADTLALQTDFWSMTVIPRATLTANEGNIRFGGSADIPEASVTFKTLPASLPQPAADVRVRGRAARAADEPDGSIEGTLNIRLGDEVRLNLLALTVRLTGELRAEIEGSEVVGLHGELDMADGSLSASGRSLQVTDGRLVFSGPPTLPYVDLLATREVENQDPAVSVGLRIRGRSDALKTTVYSDPVMSETRALSFLVLGRDFNETSEADNNQLLGAAISLGLSQTQGVVQQLRGALGLDELSALAAEQNEVAIVAGKKISDDLYVRYSYNALSAVGALIIRYHLTDRWRLEATNDANSSMDLLYEFSR